MNKRLLFNNIQKSVNRYNWIHYLESSRTNSDSSLMNLLCLKILILITLGFNEYQDTRLSEITETVKALVKSHLIYISKTDHVLLRCHLTSFGKAFVSNTQIDSLSEQVFMRCDRMIHSRINIKAWNQVFIFGFLWLCMCECLTDILLIATNLFVWVKILLIISLIVPICFYIFAGGVVLKHKHFKKLKLRKFNSEPPKQQFMETLARIYDPDFNYMVSRLRDSNEQTLTRNIFFNTLKQQFLSNNHDVNCLLNTDLDHCSLLLNLIMFASCK